MKRAIVVPDIHYPLESKAAVKCVLKAIKIVKPNIFICLGDVGEWSSVSHWKYKKVKRPPLEFILPEIYEELDAVNKGLDELDKVLSSVGCKKKYMIQGNHDAWLDSFVDEQQSGNYFNSLRFKHAVRLNDRGYQYKPYGEYLKIGKLYFYHGGHYTTMNHTRQHAMNLGKNIVYAHLHDVQRSSVTHIDGTHASYSLGCLKDMSSEKNKWLKGRNHNWSHAFGIVDWFKNGSFRLDVVDITDGKTFIWGKEINGNK